LITVSSTQLEVSLYNHLNHLDSFISIITNIYLFTHLFFFIHSFVRSFISGWIQKEGDQIAKQAISSLKAALTNQVKYIEILFDPVPNLGENKTNISSSKFM